MTVRARRRLAFLGGFLLYFAALWSLWDTALLYPVKIFVVFLHELSHAVAALLTGGSVERILLDPRQGGLAVTRGGIPFLTLSAGYLGSLLWGALFILLGFSRRLRPRWVVSVFGGALLALTVLWIRSPFGLLFGLLFGLGLLAAGRYLSEAVNRVLILGLGLTSCLYALLDIKSDILDRPHLPSDAAQLARMTGIPTAVWGFLWIAVALLVCAALLRWVARRVEGGLAPSRARRA